MNSYQPSSYRHFTGFNWVLSLLDFAGSRDAPHEVLHGYRHVYIELKHPFSDCGSCVGVYTPTWVDIKRLGGRLVGSWTWPPGQSNVRSKGRQV